MRCRTRTLICFWLSCVVLVSGAWKNAFSMRKSERKNDKVIKVGPKKQAGCNRGISTARAFLAAIKVARFKLVRRKYNYVKYNLKMCPN